MGEAYVLGIDAGGTYFKSSLVSKEGRILKGSQQKCRVDSDGTKDEILNAYEAVISAAIKTAEERHAALAGIGVSTPGPFDYEHHASLMTHKMKSIRGLDLKKELEKRCPIRGMPMRFLHDSHAFLLGEHKAGAASGFCSAAGITVGTGTGFALMRGGRLLENPDGGPYVSIYGRPYKGAAVEDFVSRRGIIRQYSLLSGRNESEGFDAYDIEKFATEKNDGCAFETYAQVGRAIAECLHDILIEQRTECLVLGGQIAKGFPLMEREIREGLSDLTLLRKIAAGENLDFSAQIGAADRVFQGLGETGREKTT